MERTKRDLLLRATDEELSSLCRLEFCRGSGNGGQKRNKTSSAARVVLLEDERFAAVISNNSGYGGAASSKRGAGERITDFIRLGSDDWFCEGFKDFAGDKEDEKPYDQSFLLSLIAPRLLLVGSAELDRGADPTAELLTALHSSAAWELLGKRGLITPDEMPRPGVDLDEGDVLYHYRDGKHFLSRDDWMAYIKFLDKKFK